MPIRDDFNAMTMKFGAAAIASGVSLAFTAISMWNQETDRVIISVLFAALTLFIANSIENDIIEKYNNK